MRPSMLFNVLILFLFVQTSFCVSPTIKDVCSKISGGSVDYNFCVQALEADPKSEAADVLGLAAISLKLSIANATSIESKIMEFLKNVSDPTTKESMETCSHLYENTTITVLKQSADFIASKNFTAAEDVIGSASIVGIICAEELRETPLAKDCDNLSRLIFLATAVIHEILSTIDLHF
ncbi:putative invertase inhibitor [Phoenix dactylifera]|uniref:Invertase inhibitor n=1 Tax=Phoenix dactylifera TaxID=42345 RepID=A0A8B8ZZ97_PHODC|nr:putative invertase inhibitor [Phoenix dactylifera]